MLNWGHALPWIFLSRVRMSESRSLAFLWVFSTASTALSASLARLSAYKRNTHAQYTFTPPLWHADIFFKCWGLVSGTLPCLWGCWCHLTDWMCPLPAGWLGTFRHWSRSWIFWRDSANKRAVAERKMKLHKVKYGCCRWSVKSLFLFPDGAFGITRVSWMHAQMKWM